MAEAAGAISPFEIAVPDSALVDLRERLTAARWPDALQDSGWSYGTDLAYLRELCAYWRDHFDWRTREAELNQLPQYTTEIDGLRIHFVHRRAPRPGALPLVITHGWPGSFAEFEQVVEPLASGSGAGDAFHVICPSLPGYGFSQAPHTPGWSARRIARTWAALMQRLGYARYGAQGGDWGSVVSTLLGVEDPEHCAAIHLNFVLAGPPKDDPDPMAGLTPEERDRLAAASGAKDETGYQAIQGTRPQTLGYALNDSPIGLAAWIVEKFRAWSDCGGDVEKSFSKDQLLTHISLYWLTGSITSSMRLYTEQRRDPKVGASRVPTGAALFPGELVRAPRRWAEARYNLVHWSEQPRGGHFAAMEEPELFVTDVRHFFREFQRA